MTSHKLIIVGGGPAGLTAGIYAGRANLNPLVVVGDVEGTNLPGGQLMLTTEIENYPAFPTGIQGPELMAKFREQAEHFGAKTVEKWATEFDLKPGGPFRVKIGGEWHETKSLILANGASAKWLGAPNEEKYINHGISACATCDGPLRMFRKKELYVIGGGDSAAEEALFLTNFASKVILLVRSDKLRASKIMQKRLIEHPLVLIMWNTVIVSYKGEENLEGIIVKNVLTNEVSDLPAVGLFMAIGHDPNTKYLKRSGVELDDEGYIKVRENIYTNIEGVFAAGDVHDTVYRQAVTAAGFGCMAAIACERWLESSKL